MSDHIYDELRRLNVFCDAVLYVGSEKFPVHKILLCSSSRYFRDMFEIQSAPDDRDFPVAEISPKIMSLVLEWIYTESITLSRETILDLLLAAHMLQLEELIEIGFQFLENNLCPENCIGLWKISNVALTKIRDLARRFILSHFEEVVHCDEFQQLTAQELISLIEEDELIVKNETAVYQAILHWTNHDLQQRRAEFSRLLTKVRLPELSPHFVEHNVLNNALVTDDIECISAISKSMVAAYEVSVYRGSRHHLVRPRIPGEILLAIGGWSCGDPINQIEAYDYKADRWFEVTNHEERPRAYHGSVFFKGSVYCVGGFDKREHFNSVRRLDLGTRTWHEMPCMYYKRCYVSVTVLNDCIYAMGGYNGKTRLNTAEVYDPKSRQWSLIAPMIEQRSDAKCTTFNGKIYICGGFNGTAVLQTVECYCAETNQWSLIAPMTTRRTGVGVIAHANLIYAVGGYDGNMCLSSVEAYNPSTDSWQQVASIALARRNFGIAVLNDRIFIVGGYNGTTTSYSVESYDHLADTWSEACDVKTRRSALSCCVISGLPNMADYTVCRTWLSQDDLPLLDTESDEEAM